MMTAIVQLPYSTGSAECNQHQTWCIVPSPLLAKHACSTKLAMSSFGTFYCMVSKDWLAGRETLVNIFQETLTLEYDDNPLSKY
jgi:hypothetical protein